MSTILICGLSSQGKVRRIAEVFSDLLPSSAAVEVAKTPDLKIWMQSYLGTSGIFTEAS